MRQSHNFDGQYFELGWFLVHGSTRKFTQHEIIFPNIYNVEGFGKVENYLEIDVIAIALTAHIPS